MVVVANVYMNSGSYCIAKLSGLARLAPEVGHSALGFLMEPQLAVNPKHVENQQRIKTNYADGTIYFTYFSTLMHLSSLTRVCLPLALILSSPLASFRSSIFLLSLTATAYSFPFYSTRMLN